MIDYGGNNNVAALQVTTGIYPSTSVPVDIRETIKNRSLLSSHRAVGLMLYPGLKIHIQDTNETATVIRMITGRTGAYWDDWDFDITLNEFHDAVDHCREVDPVKYRDILPGVYTTENLLNYLFIRGESSAPERHTVTLTYKFGTNGWKYVSGYGFTQVSANENYRVVSVQVYHGSSYTITLDPATGWECKNGDQTITQINVENVVEDRNLTVVMMPLYYSVSASTNPSAQGISISLSQPETGSAYKFGETCTAQVSISSEYYLFDHYTNNGSYAGTGTGDNHQYSFQVGGSTEIVAHFSSNTPTRTITATVNPEGKGTVNNQQSFTQRAAVGSTVTIAAMPNTDAGGNAKTRFTNWTEDGEVVSTEQVLNITVGGSDRNLVANFADAEYSITAYSDPSGAGSVTGAGTYTYGQTATLSVTNSNPNQYTFIGWIINGVNVSTSMQYTTPAIVGNATYVASFTENGRIMVSVKTDGKTGCKAKIKNSETQVEEETSSASLATVSFYPNDTCVLTATPSANHNFSKWVGPNGYENTSASLEMQITGENRTYTARFSGKPKTISVSANPTNGGTVSGGGTYNYGTSCTVSATPASGYQFVNWTENGNLVSNSAEYTFTVDGDHTLVANFSANSYLVKATPSPTSGGDTSGSGSYTYGQSCTVHATANTDYTFSKWTENGSQVSTSANYTFTVTGDRDLVAVFIHNGYTVNVSADPTSGGTVTGGGTFSQGDNCTVEATHNEGYIFTNWTENGTVVSTNANYSFTVTGNRTLVANFSLTKVTLKVELDPSGQSGLDVTVQGQSSSFLGEHQIDYGTGLKLVAHPSSSYSFNHWEVKYGDSGSFSNVGTETTYTTGRITQTTTIRACFSVSGHQVTLNNQTSGAGSFSDVSPVSVSHGGNYTVKFNRNTGYVLNQMTVNGTNVHPTLSGDQYSYTISNITEDKAVVISFNRPKYNLTLVTDPNGSGQTSESGSSSYYGGSSVTVTATPAAGYEFAGWYEGSVNRSTDASYSFTMPYSGLTLTAKFTEINYLNVYAWGCSAKMNADAITEQLVKTKSHIQIPETSTGLSYGMEIPENTVATNARILVAIPKSFDHGTVTQDGTFFVTPTNLNDGTTNMDIYLSKEMTIDGTQYVVVETNAITVMNRSVAAVFGKVDGNRWSTIWSDTSSRRIPFQLWSVDDTLIKSQNSNDYQ